MLLLDEADGLLRRGVVSASYQWAIGGLPEVDEELADDWEVRMLPEDESNLRGPAVSDSRPRGRTPSYVKKRTATAGPAQRHGPAAGRRRH